MRNKIFSTFLDAVADIPDGSTIMFPGFGYVGIPRNLIFALTQQGAKNLVAITNDHGGLDEDVGVDVGTVIKAGQVKKVCCAFSAPTHPSQVTAFYRLYVAGNWRFLHPDRRRTHAPGHVGRTVIRAAAHGIGAFFTPTSVGTELAEGKEHREINGKTFVLEYPLHADYAFVRAWKADRLGNLQFRLAGRSFNPVMAMAAKTTSWKTPWWSPASWTRTRSTSPASTSTAWWRYPRTVSGTSRGPVHRSPGPLPRLRRFLVFPPTNLRGTPCP